eukprot:12024856-Karenia_brevis.AAC.1
MAFQCNFFDDVLTPSMIALEYVLQPFVIDLPPLIGLDHRLIKSLGKKKHTNPFVYVFIVLPISSNHTVHEVGNGRL